MNLYSRIFFLVQESHFEFVSSQIENNLPSYDEVVKNPHKYPLNKPVRTTETVVRVYQHNLPTYEEALLM